MNEILPQIVKFVWPFLIKIRDNSLILIVLNNPFDVDCSVSSWLFFVAAYQLFSFFSSSVLGLYTIWPELESALTWLYSEMINLSPNKIKH